MTEITTNAPPSRNPTDDNSMIGMFNVVLTKFLQNVDDMLPAKVIAYNRTTNQVQVQPLISIVTTNGLVISRAQILSATVLQLGAGGLLFNLPLKTGDLGLLKACDRDISLFKQTLAQSQPNTARKHSFEDGVFIPTPWGNFTTAASDSESAVIQSTDGAFRVAFNPVTKSAAVTDESGYSPSPNCIWDMQSTTKAAKIPVMSHAQKNSIPSPEDGMMVFDTGDGISISPHYSFYNSSAGGWS